MAGAKESIQQNLFVRSIGGSIKIWWSFKGGATCTATPKNKHTRIYTKTQGGRGGAGYVGYVHRDAPNNVTLSRRA